MRYLALVTDFDGVLAHDNNVSSEAVSAVQRLKASGRRAILCTGRRLDDLQNIFPQLSIFDCVIAENGAVVYEPSTRRETLLAKPPAAELLTQLKEAGVAPLEVGRVVVATWLPHHLTALRVIQEMGLELQLIFNRDAVMILPAGVNKGTGMDYALRKLGLSRHEVIGIGDSENDHSFLERCECAATVANGIPSIRKVANIVTEGANGSGLIELIDEIIADDLSRMHGRLPQHLIEIGRHPDGTFATIPPYGMNILIAGPSCSGKSTVTAGLVERLMQRDYQLCIVDPEGDYGTLHDVITLGNQRHAVTESEVLAVLEDPAVTLNVNLLGIPLADRPDFFGRFFPTLQALRTRTGRPHWIVLDEAHHMMPPEWAHVGRALPRSLGETVLVTVHPDQLPSTVLSLVNLVIAVGPNPRATIQTVANSIGQTLTWPNDLDHENGKIVVWFPGRDEVPYSVEILPGRAERIRHHRKYSEGNMRYRSFFFRGPDKRHNLRAQNLVIFSQIAEGIDEETWVFHLRRGDYSHWLRKSVKDSYLADEVARIEKRNDVQPAEARRLIRGLIEARYTLPA